jgi:hypothetical protein
LRTQFEVISLSGAAEKLLGASPQSMNDKGMKTKVRRLYDIANVLTSLRLIDKVRFRFPTCLPICLPKRLLSSIHPFSKRASFPAPAL